MKILELQRQIEESLVNLPTADIPRELEGLRHLPVDGHVPRVSIHYLQSNRKVREDASTTYFDPETCVVTIKFIPIAELPHETPLQEYSPAGLDEGTDELDYETKLDQLLEELRGAERTRPFVGLKWFRDQYLPQSGHGWALDTAATGLLLQLAIEQDLVLTNKVPNPIQPLHPVTAIRVNRRHRRFQPMVREDAAFKPVRIRGGMISDTVVSERR